MIRRRVALKLSANATQTNDALASRARHIRIDHATEHGHRHIPAANDCVVERGKIIARTERALCAFAEAVDRGVADFVAAGLAWP